MDEAHLLSTADTWIAQGWFNELDRAFLQFLQRQDSQASDAVLWAGALVSHQLGRGHVCLDIKALADDPVTALGLAVDEANPEATSIAAGPEPLRRFNLDDWRTALRRSPLVEQGNGKTPLVLQGERLYLRRFWQYEQTVATAIHKRLVAEAVAPLPGDLSAHLARLFPDSSQRTDCQKIACALSARSRFSIITGGPGTGKTTTLARLLALLIRVKDKRVIRLAAPTGKAAARVSQSIGEALDKLDVADTVKSQIPRRATTLHRLLGTRPDTRTHVYNRRNPLAADIVIVDEASMIGLEMMASLLDALTDDTQLILLGDKDQLASVEAGSVFGDLCLGIEENGAGEPLAVYSAQTVEWIKSNTGENVDRFQGHGTALNQHTTMLCYSRRFGSDSGIKKLAMAVNTGNGAAAQMSWDSVDLTRLTLRNAGEARLKDLLCGKQDMAHLPTKRGPQGYGHFLRHLRQERPVSGGDHTQWAREVLEAFNQFQLLCAVRHGIWGIEALNQRIEHWLFPEQPFGNWYEGRPVMITRNNYTLGLMNGDVGITLTGDQGTLRVAFQRDDSEIRWVSPSRLPDVETAYAMTVHKSQGSEFNHVALALPDAASPVLTKELIYTAITRAKQHFTLIETDPAIFEQALQSKVARSSGLSELIQKSL